MASKPESGGTANGEHVCPHCAKPFARLCDLNKHAKSHSRPFKCSIRTCKYHEHGWPTAKELERHVNDKHSVAPRTFACRFPPCTYKSKRESNCKQHMEKTHRWTYVRSKSNGKHMTAHHHDDLDHRIDNAGPKTYPTSSPVSSLVSPSRDFVLFPYDNDPPLVIGEDDDDDVGFEPPQGQDSQVYLPWTSPNTRIRKNENFIEMFTQTWNGAPERPMANSDNLIDPTLPQYTHSDLPCFVAPDTADLYPTQAFIKVETAAAAVQQPSSSKTRSRTGSFSGDVHDRRALPIIQTTAHAPSSGGQAPFTASSVPGGQAPDSIKPTLTRRHIDDDEEDEDDNQSPQKRRKSNPVENFSDSDMPDIFRFAHPRIYDRDQKEKYSPCHSSHRDISTLVRHLSRPAHRLQVTERFISSFDVNDAEYRHPRLGLCRRCWRAFHEREEFDDHVTYDCDKVSKGKREKWRILLENFTPLMQQPSGSQQPDRTLSFNQAVDRVGLERSSDLEDVSFSPEKKGSWPNHSTTPTSGPPSAAPNLDMISRGRTVSNAGFVPLNEHLQLQKEHHELHQEHRALHQKHQQLVQATKALLPPHIYQETFGSGQKPVHGFLTQRGGHPLDTFYPPGVSKGRIGEPEAGTGSNIKDTASDQESLVLHMDSQCTDVDIQGLMYEAPESLSRQNSGLSSSSRSTVHHVPTSPPPLPAEDRSDCEDDSEEPRRCSPNHRPPSSLPDSAYGTDPRRCSLGEQGGQMPPGTGNVDNTLSSERHIHHQFPRQFHDSSNKMGMGGVPLNRRPAVAGSGGDMTPMTWGNPWGNSAATPAPAAAGGNASTTTTTMAQHTFADGEVATPAAGEACEPIPSFDFYNNMDLGSFDLQNDFF